MKPRTVTIAIASLVLFSQLITLNPVFYFTPYTTGEFKNVVEKMTIVQRQAIYEAVFASRASVPHDAMVFVGDIMLGRNVEHIMEKEGPQYPFAGLDISTLYSTAAVIGNFESSMALEHTQTPAYAMKFSVQEAAIPKIKQAHFTHLSLANNHSFDFGISGYINTQEKLRSQSLVPFGSGEDITPTSISVVHTVRGDIALIGINAVNRIPSDEELHTILTLAQKRSSFQVVYIHWGAEYELTHNQSQRNLAEALVDAGADLIVGHHPHVTQDIDLIKGVVVFYSLGNYIFDQYFSQDVQEGLLIGLDLATDPTLTLLPVTSVEHISSPTIMKQQAYREFLDNLANRSHPSLREKIRAGSIPLLDSVATSTKVAMM